MKIDFPDSPSIRELLEQFGPDAEALAYVLNGIPPERVSERIVAIAQALSLAHAKGEVKALVDELDKNDPRLNRRG